MEFVKLQHPFRLICVGASSTGKTRIFDYILKHQNETISVKAGSKKIDRLIICYAVHDSCYSEWCQLAPVCTHHQGLPNFRDLEDGSLIKKGCNNLIIIEDLDDRENECETIHRLFTIYSHHYGCSVLYSQHNLFMKNKRSVLISRNCNYLILMQNPRDLSAVKILGYQTHPSKPLFLSDAFRQAVVEGKNRWLLCDFSSTCPDRYRFRETFTEGAPLVYYMPKKTNENEEVKTKKKSI